MIKHLPLVFCSALLGITCISQPSSARSPMWPFPGSAGGCVQNENAQVSISFNGMDKDVSAVKSLLDAKVAEVKALGAQQHFTKFSVQSTNYNINSNYGSGMESQFNYSGTVSFSILPSDKAADFMVLLTKKGYHANINVNNYSNGNCDETPNASPTTAAPIPAPAEPSDK